MAKNRVQYVVDARDITLRSHGHTGSACGDAWRFDRLLTTFYVGPTQRKKIKSGRGSISITTRMIERGDIFCQRR